MYLNLAGFSEQWLHKLVDAACQVPTGVAALTPEQRKEKEKHVLRALIEAEAFYSILLKKLKAKRLEMENIAAKSAEELRQLSAIKEMIHKMEHDFNRFAYFWAIGLADGSRTPAENADRIEKALQKALANNKGIEEVDHADWYLKLDAERSGEFAREVATLGIRDREQYLIACEKRGKAPKEANITAFLIDALKQMKGEEDIDFALFGINLEASDADVIALFTEARTEASQALDAYIRKEDDPAFNALWPAGKVKKILREPAFAILTPPKKKGEEDPGLFERVKNYVSDRIL